MTLGCRRGLEFPFQTLCTGSLVGLTSSLPKKYINFNVSVTLHPNVVPPHAKSQPDKNSNHNEEVGPRVGATSGNLLQEINGVATLDPPVVHFCVVLCSFLVTLCLSSSHCE